METRKRFEQVFIKSEADLPKRDIFGSNVLIIFHEKYTDITKAEEGYSSTWDDYFLKNIDWYLLPLEPAEVSEEIKPPKWYSKQEMYDWLLHSSYSREIAEELSQIWADDLQAAFNKGWDKRGYELKSLPQVSQKVEMPSNEELEREAVSLARQYAKQSVGDFAVGFNWGAKLVKDKINKNNQ